MEKWHSGSSQNQPVMEQFGNLRELEWEIYVTPEIHDVKQQNLGNPEDL